MTLRVVLGRQGSGKTWRLARIVRAWAAELPDAPIFIHDDRRNMPGALGNLAPVAAHWRDVTDFARNGLHEGTAKNGDKQLRCRYRVNLFYQCPADEVAAWGRACIFARQPAIICIDELDKLPPQLIQRRDAAYALCHYGRPVPVHTCGSSRAPQNIDKQWLNNADALDLYNIATRQTLAQIRECGLPGAEQASRWLPLLRRFRYITLSSAAPLEQGRIP